jgi:hypothetical protein
MSSFASAATGKRSNLKLTPAAELDTFLDGCIDLHVAEEKDAGERQQRKRQQQQQQPVPKLSQVQKNRFSLRRSRSAIAMPLSDRDKDVVAKNPKLQRVLGLTASGEPLRARRPSLLQRHFSLPRGLASKQR